VETASTQAKALCVIPYAKVCTSKVTVFAPPLQTDILNLKRRAEAKQLWRHTLVNFWGELGHRICSRCVCTSS
jgi:hypothetical protein